MLWRVALFVGVLVAVLLMAGSVWTKSITHTVPPHGACLERPTTGSGWAQIYGCAVYASAGGTVTPHAEAARDLRYAAGGVFVVTLAALPTLGAGRRRGRPVDSPGGAL